MKHPTFLQPPTTSRSPKILGVVTPPIPRIDTYAYTVTLNGLLPIQTGSDDEGTWRLSLSNNEQSHTGPYAK